MRKYGVIGNPVEHSFSPKYFAQKFEKLDIQDAVYETYAVEDIVSIRQLVTDESLSGFNVTIPHKESILAYLDEITEAARQIGAVNTVKVEDGKLIGYNTDFLGFRKSLKGLVPRGVVTALIFGTGGSSKAVKFALQQMGVLHSSVSRGKDAEYTYSDIATEEIAEHRILINTTPLGMSPKEDKCVDIPYDAITSRHTVYDLVYTPHKTLFLEQSEKQGARIKNGLQMLEIQADESWNIWNAKK